MHRKGWQKITVCAGVMAALFLTAGADSALTTTMAGQKELAGMSYLLDQYCTNQQSVGVTDPEAIVAFAATEMQNPVDTSVPGQEIPAIDGGIADDVTTPADPAAGQQTVPTDPAAGQQTAPADPAAGQQAAAAGQQAAGPAAAAQPQPTPKPESEYKNIGISIAQEYVNVRKKPSTESEIVGKLYRGSAAKIVKRRGEWVKIRSGKVTGYINKEYLAIGFSAEKLIDDFGTKWATVTTETLKVREKKSTDCTILTLIPEGETYKVIREDKDWVKIEVDDTTKGFVAKEYVKIKVRFKKAVSIAEEKAEEERKAAAAAAAAEAAQAEAERKAAAARQAEEARRQAEAARKAAAKKAASKKSSIKSSNKSNAGNKAKNSSSSNSSSNKSSISSGNSDAGSVVGSGNGASIASYALKFVGNPYVYGGTSLTHGTDCSGFTQAVFRRFGISLPRTSGGQSGVGAKISVGNAKAGDLIFYASGGRVNHVALCIGNGRVVHASNPSVGITTSNIYYRTPYCARRIVS